MIRLLFAIQLVTMGAMEMSGPFWPLRLRELCESDVAFTFAATGTYVAPMLGVALTGGLWGKVGDRYGHKLMILRALAALAVIQVGLAFAADAWVIVLLRFLQGACAGFAAPAQAYGVALETRERRGRLFAFLQVSTNVGSLGGAVIGGVILDHASFFWINIAAAVLCVGCAFVTSGLLPPAAPVERTRQAEAAPIASVWRNPIILGLIAAQGCLLVTRLMPQMAFAVYVQSTFGVENWVIGLCYGLMASGFVVSATLWAGAFEGRSWRHTLDGIAAVTVACAVTVLVAGLTQSVVVFAISYFVWGILLGATTPILSGLISQQASATQQGHVLGVVHSSIQASSMTGVALGGLVNQVGGASAIFPAVSVLYLVSCGLVLRMRRATATSQPPL